jgi:two-component system chemotaxis response regulator CheV
MPVTTEEINRVVVGPELVLPAGSVILAVDDSAVARSVIELGLKAMGVPYIMTRTGKEAWERLQSLSDEAQAQGKSARDKVAIVLTDLEMPEMDGFTLTRLIKQDVRFKTIPVVIHSSLTGATNENHVKSVGADAYVAKFAPRELAATIRRVLPVQ